MADKITTNLDQVLKQLAKMEDQATNEVIQDARNELRAIARKTLPQFRAITPVDSGALKRSTRVKSRSKRGRTTVSVVWANNRYGAFVNNAKNSPHLHIFTNKFKSLKQSLDAQGTEAITDVFEKFLKKNGVRVKR